MNNPLTIAPLGPFHASLRLPGSKSLTNRALLLAALADGQSTLRYPLVAQDAQRMTAALTDLGFTISAAGDAGYVVIQGGNGTISATEATLDLGNAGTAMRSLTAACCLGRGVYRLDGNPRMRQRPIGELVALLRRLGARIDFLNQEGCPPLRVQGGGLAGGELQVTTTRSSQFITALLVIGPYCREPLTLNFEGPVTSRPYVEMTVAMMRRFGAEVQVDPQFRTIAVNAGGYRACDYTVEPDASSATYFMAAAAITPGSRCTIEGLGRQSIQGDAAFADLLHQMGAGLLFGADFITILAPDESQPLRGVDVDMNHMPDAAMTLAAIAPLCTGPTAIRNVGNLRFKETDRLAALQTELHKLSATATIEGDDLLIEPPADGRIAPASIDTYDDHRMAMSFAIPGLRHPGITINDPECVNKTFPDFFEYLNRLGETS